MLAGAVLCLALEVWMTDTVDTGIQLYTAASIVGLLLAARSACRMMGVINPSGVSTATAMSAVS